MMHVGTDIQILAIWPTSPLLLRDWNELQIFQKYPRLKTIFVDPLYRKKFSVFVF